MNKITKEVEDKIIELYNNGLSGLKICSELNLKHNSIVYKILKRNKIESRHENYVRTEAHRAKARETLEKIKRKYTPEERMAHSIKGGKERGKQLTPEHQSKYGREGGKKTILSHPEQAIQNWSIKNPELQSKISSETAKRTHQNDPTLASRMGKSTHLKHPELSSIIAKRTHERDPALASRMGKSTHLKHPEQASLMGKSTHQKHPELSRENAFKAIESQRKKRPWYWENVPFASKEEMEVAKLLLDKPIEGINTHVKIGWSLEVDFYPNEKVFVEYHPNLWDKKLNRYLTEKEYKAPRIKTLQANEKYKDKRIEFIFDSIKTRKFLKRIKEIKEQY